MAAQREKARSRSAFVATGKGDAFAVGAAQSLEALGGVADQFEGYTTTRLAGIPIVALFDEQRQPVDGLTEDQKGYVALARTPFYLEAGGQGSDRGRIPSETGTGGATGEGLERIGPGFPPAHRVDLTGGGARGPPDRPAAGR